MTKQLIGTVVSTKMTNVVVVEVESRRPHPMYKKVMRKNKHFKAHNENSAIRIGDKVRIIETRPLSKDMHFKVTEVLA